MWRRGGGWGGKREEERGGTQRGVAARLVRIAVLLVITLGMMGIGQSSFKNREIM